MKKLLKAILLSILVISFIGASASQSFAGKESGGLVGGVGGDK